MDKLEQINQIYRDALEKIVNSDLLWHNDSGNRSGHSGELATKALKDAESISKESS